MANKDTKDSNSEPEGEVSSKSSSESEGSSPKSESSASSSVGPSNGGGGVAGSFGSKATAAMPQSVQNVSQKAQKAAELAQKARRIASMAKNTVGIVVKVFGNPYTWIGILIAAIVLAVVLGGIGTQQTVGRNENADGCYGIGGGSASAIDVTGEDSDDGNVRIDKVGSWLMGTTFEAAGGQGFTKEQAAAIIGNFQRESGVTSDVVQGGHRGSRISNEEAMAKAKSGAVGFGFAQWTGGRAVKLINKANAAGKPWYDTMIQLELFTEEINASYGNSLRNAGFFDSGKSAAELAIIFHDVFEGSGDSPEVKQERATNATNAMSIIGGGSSGKSGMSCSKGSIDTSSAAALAVSLSWPTREQALVGADSCGITKVKPEYKEAKAKAEELPGSSKDSLCGGQYYADCGRFVATVVKLAYDPSFPWGPTVEQRAYMRNHPEMYQEYTNYEERKPGDIWVVDRPEANQYGHIVMYVGEVEGVDSIAHASYHHRVANLQEVSYINSGFMDDSGRHYAAFHFVGTPQTSS